MSHDFLSNFEPVEVKQPEAQQPDEAAPVLQEKLYFGEQEHIRSLGFVWPDGSRKFLAYHRLEGGELSEDYMVIKLYFGSELAELVGLNLLPLFNAFMAHERRLIYCDDPRYNDLAEGETVVNTVTITTL